jgi:hypothetical protein
MYLFGKSGPRRDSSDPAGSSSTSLSLKYPFLARIPHKIQDLSIEKRESSYDKIYNFLKEAFPVQEGATCQLWQIRGVNSIEDRG